MSEQENLDAVRRVYEAFGRGDVQTILDNLTEDVTWEIPGPPSIPYAGRYFGPEQVARFFQLIAENVEMQEFEAREFIVQGDQVAAIGSYKARARPTGRGMESDFLMNFTLRDGKIASFRQYADTAGMLNAFGHTERMLKDVSGVV